MRTALGPSPRDPISSAPLQRNPSRPPALRRIRASFAGWVLQVWALQPEVWRYFRTSKLVAHGAAFGPSDDAMRPYSSELLQIDLGYEPSRRRSLIAAQAETDAAR